MPPDKRSGPEGPPRTAAAQQQVAISIADQQRRAAARLWRQAEHRRVCAELEQVASLVEYYRQPKGCFYCTVVEGWAA